MFYHRDLPSPCSSLLRSFGHEGVFISVTSFIIIMEGFRFSYSHDLVLRGGTAFRLPFMRRMVLTIRINP